jgi:hypothetical protein
MGKTIPIITLKETADGFQGIYTPVNLNGGFPFKAGPLVDDKLELAITDKLGQHIHFSFEFQPDGKAKVSAWHTVEEIQVEIERLAERRDLTPKQRQAAKLELLKEMRKAGKPVFIGIFHKVKDPGHPDI